MLRLHRPRGEVLLALLGLVSPACGGDGGDNGGMSPNATSIMALTGDEQVGLVGQALAEPLVVVVTQAGTPLAGATVNWTTASGGSLEPTSVITDANGQASTRWTLGTTAGAQTAAAAVSGASGSPLTFNARAEPGPATTLSDAGGNNQTGEIGAQLATALQAKVADEFGNGVPGVAVAWAATGATVSAATVPSNNAGVSAVNVTLGGAAGPVTITASADGLDGSPLTFNAVATPPAPIPTTASVQVGNIFFSSNNNMSANPAVDTVAAGGTVTWSWVPSSTTHNVQSTGSPSFTSSSLQDSGRYQVTFSTPGSYSYSCAVHPGQMTGRIVVR